MRYIILVILNIPVILLALTNIVTQFKLNKISKRRFYVQVTVWVIILILIIGSFPVYNYMIGAPILDSHELSLFDVAQTTAIVYLFYIINNQRRKSEQNERAIRELHQELSIRLSRKD